MAAAVLLIATLYATPRHAAPSRMVPVADLTSATELLALDEDGSVVTPLVATNVPPGQTVAKRFRVRWPARPDYGLAIRFSNTVDRENGCSGSESLVDSTCGTAAGELSQNLLMAAIAAPVAFGTSCSFSGLSFPAGQPLRSATGWTFQAPKDTDLCVELRATLPWGTGNEAQSDGVTFDVDFDASSAESWNIKMGPQAMEGNLKVNPGDVLEAGYDFSLPGDHPSTIVTFRGGWVEFVPACGTKATAGKTKFIVPLSAYRYPEVDQGNPQWWPSAVQSSPLVFEGSLTLTSDILAAACGSQPVTLKTGGTFYALMDADHVVKANIRWHYRAHGTSGSWSGTLGPMLPE